MKGTRIIVVFAALLAGLMALSIVPVLAQDKQTGKMQIVRDKVQADKKLLVAENMELTESEAKAF